MRTVETMRAHTHTHVFCRYACLHVCSGMFMYSFLCACTQVRVYVYEQFFLYLCRQLGTFTNRSSSFHSHALVLPACSFALSCLCSLSFSISLFTKLLTQDNSLAHVIGLIAVGADYAGQMQTEVLVRSEPVADVVGRRALPEFQCTPHMGRCQG